MPETQPVEESRLSDEEVKSLESVKTATGKIRSELSKIIVGQLILAAFNPDLGTASS